MQIIIIGGSRGTGAQMATLAQSAGHDVAAVSRSGTAPDGVAAVAGDATDPVAISAIIAGADAVVVTVGGAKGSARHRAAVTRAVVTAMQDTGVRRILVQSSLGAGDSLEQLPKALRFITKVVLGAPLKDHTEQEEAVQASGLDWTIVRPPGLTNKEPTGRWLVAGPRSDVRLRGSITRADLAACLLETLGDESTIGEALGVSNA